jgi:hypothetical protein
MLKKDLQTDGNFNRGQQSAGAVLVGVFALILSFAGLRAVFAGPSSGTSHPQTLQLRWLGMRPAYA